MSQKTGHVALAVATFGRKKAWAWFNEPCPWLSGRCPRDCQPEEVKAVLAALRLVALLEHQIG